MDRSKRSQGVNVQTLKRRLSDIFHYSTDERRRAFERQRRISGLAERQAAAGAISARLPAAAAPLPEHDAAYDHLARCGWVDLPGLVEPDLVEEVRAYFAPLEARDPYRPELGTYRAPLEVPPCTHVSHYDAADIVRAPYLMRWANDPRVLDLVARWIGGAPTLAALRVWWSTPVGDGTPEHAELFHRDVDDLRFIKLFVYLTDVDDSTGPHVFVEGSHRIDRLTEIRRYTDDEIMAAFGGAAVRSFKGPAGTAFLEDTYGMHRGVPPMTGPRLIFQPLYAQRPLIYGPRKPVAGQREVHPGLDPYINRVFLRAGS